MGSNSKPQFIPGQCRFVLGLPGKQTSKPFRFCLPYAYTPSMPPILPLTTPTKEYKPRLKSVSPFECGEPDLQWAIPTFSMPHIPEEVVSEGSRSVRSASPLQHASTLKKGKSTPGQEGPKTPKGATKPRVPPSAPLTPSRATNTQAMLPAERSCTDSFACHTRKVIKSQFSSVWFCSKSTRTINGPPAFPPGVALGVNDIFYHVISSTGKAQLWLWSGSAWLTAKVSEMRTFEDREMSNIYGALNKVLTKCAEAIKKAIVEKGPSTTAGSTIWSNWVSVSTKAQIGRWPH
ncbi:hypothetical protein BDN71DRAFT_1590623 [Pleurotus eryngii]|uniref:Uncharacterized protein n=1 Tax=Pleurotus eryngii TaxID=5323 RepID=A0A9P5ZVF2_PLEER|nr:hypothetical protein BDN71DRAFT_1590623 [Pleurotus eryngii]